ncbi:hypothetical protein M3649_21480 [Ureibacillus chungkukjangi]|uniref:hypothetical protein n=1 Tax=Ureibacillus chungkukjangi TaxID=1202712 RepID=UPI00203BA11B|nr:hypothetical protein [Ureibacillus chungkukjangi]MCM3390658.1 hypothetical protein [Ureibacillus chungkukjangi]
MISLVNINLTRCALIFFLFTIFFSQVTYASSKTIEPKIIEYASSPYKVKNGWVCIPKGEIDLSIEVRAENTSKIFFYLTPTGTNTFSKRKLIASSEEENGIFKINHTFNKNESILYHLSVDAVGKNGQSTSDILFNISRCE